LPLFSTLFTELPRRGLLGNSVAAFVVSGARRIWESSLADYISMYATGKRARVRRPQPFLNVVGSSKRRRKSVVNLAASSWPSL
jgi:hypothetical protein